MEFKWAMNNDGGNMDIEVISEKYNNSTRAERLLTKQITELELIWNQREIIYVKMDAVEQ